MFEPLTKTFCLVFLNFFVKILYCGAYPVSLSIALFNCSVQESDRYWCADHADYPVHACSQPIFWIKTIMSIDDSTIFTLSRTAKDGSIIYAEGEVRGTEWMVYLKQNQSPCFFNSSDPRVFQTKTLHGQDAVL